MRLSTYLLPTLREVPAEAEIVSHKLMLRSGLIKKVGAGVYTILPLGLIITRKIEQIVREEMNRIGALELFLPVLSPAEPSGTAPTKNRAAIAMMTSATSASE